MKILMMQKNGCCIRNYKFAKVLKDRGHEVGLFTDGHTPEQVYSKNGMLKDSDAYTRVHRVKPFTDFAEMHKVIETFGYEILHAHNEPDIYAMLGMANKYNLPVIHNCHDIVSATWRKDVMKEPELNDLLTLEALAFKKADGVIFVADGLVEIAKNLYGDIGTNHKVFWNTPLKSFIPIDNELLPKLSVKDGRVHIVYEGGLNISPNVNGSVPERYYIHHFLDIIRQAEGKVAIHIYTPQYNEHIDAYFLPYKKEGLYYEGAVDPSELIKTLSQFDVGYFGNCSHNPGLNYINALPNKMFEYFAAGLPMISDNTVISCVKFAEKYPEYTKIYKGVSDCIHIVKELGTPSLDRFRFVFDDYASEIENFHERLIKGEPSVEEASNGGEN